jgi:hypothetical protein
MPSNSYIDVFNFSTPEKLANFLTAVGSDVNKYNSYFEWKNNYCSRTVGNEQHFCELCKKLNNQSEQKYYSRSELIDWWFTKSNCH